MHDHCSCLTVRVHRLNSSRRRNEFQRKVYIPAGNQYRKTAIGLTMFTSAQCLAKAVELEQRAGEGLPQDIADDYRDMALQWRRLAARARIQDRRTAAAGQA